MQEIFRVLFINLVSDIDNLLILGTILRRYSYLNVTMLAVVVLTITRSLYVAFVEVVSQLPYFQLIVGIILLWIAFKLVTKTIRGEVFQRSSNSVFTKIKVLLLLAATDFLICLDSIIVIYEFSTHMLPVIIGLFCSLFISLHFLPLIERLATNFFWINVVAGGFIAQNAVLIMVKDPWISELLSVFFSLYEKDDMVNVLANGAVIIVVLTGVISYINHRRILLK
ncbi:TerC family protein [Bacillus rubiinfantis]|uniref:TerC family protein n=1 Tax=Bacillus rubiinfantis TaxID=1499680 RepID=UPI0005A992FC|nr:hypothetical protein [Bacillus rubiinfantis]